MKKLIFIPIFLILGGCATPAQKVVITKKSCIDGEWKETDRIIAEQTQSGKTEIIWGDVTAKIDTKKEAWTPFKNMFPYANTKILDN